jgi:hypothetical protein
MFGAYTLLQNARCEPDFVDSDSTAAFTPGRHSDTPPGALQRLRLLPAGLKQLTNAELAALQKDCQINATTHTFMRLFVDRTGAPLTAGVSEPVLLQRMHRVGYSHWGAESVKRMVDRMQTYGILKKLTSKVCWSA